MELKILCPSCDNAEGDVYYCSKCKREGVLDATENQVIAEARKIMNRRNSGIGFLDITDILGYTPQVKTEGPPLEDAEDGWYLLWFSDAKVAFKKEGKLWIEPHREHLYEAVSMAIAHLQLPK